MATTPLLIVSSLLVFMTEAFNSSLPTQDLDAAMFSYVGKTAAQTSFGHLVFDLQLDHLESTFDKFTDMVATLAEASEFNSTLQATGEMYGIDRLMNKIKLVLEVVGAESHGTDYSFESGDLDPFRTQFQTKLPRSRRQIPELISLAAFGVSVYHQQQLNTIAEVARQADKNLWPRRWIIKH